MDATTTVSTLAPLAQQYGPFFFSVLYDVVIAGWASASYGKVCSRTDPPADHEERSAHRLYFFFTWSFGALITILSVYWWATHQPIYTYSGVIRMLKSGEELLSDSFFFQREYDPAESETQQTRDEKFLLVRSTPIAASQAFRMKYRKPGGAVQELKGTFGPPDAAYKIHWNQQNDENLLLPDGMTPPKHARAWWSFELVASAFAGFTKEKPPIPLDDDTRQRVVKGLQDSRVYAGAEIDALNLVLRLSPRDRVTLLSGEGPNEPLLLSVADLARHDDEELRAKATSLLRQVDALSLFTKKLADPKTHDVYRDALLRLDPEQVRIILSREGSLPSDLRKMRERVLSSSHVPRMLSPSTSKFGDRYWLSAEWRIGDFATQRCAGKVLDGVETADAISVKSAMIEPARRLTFGYFKPGILKAADALEQCGARPSFARR
jgi:hypothetical protein